MEIFCIFAKSISIIPIWEIAWTLLLRSVIDACFWLIETSEISLLTNTTLICRVRIDLSISGVCRGVPSSTLLDGRLYSCVGIHRVVCQQGSSEDLNQQTICMDAHVFPW